MFRWHNQLQSTMTMKMFWLWPGHLPCRQSHLILLDTTGCGKNVYYHQKHFATSSYCLVYFQSRPHPSHKKSFNKIKMAALNSTLYIIFCHEKFTTVLTSAIIFYTRAGERCFPTFRCQLWQGLYWCLSFHQQRTTNIHFLLLFFV